MMTATPHQLTHIQRIRAAAGRARQTEAAAARATGDVSLDLWIQFDESVSAVLGLILSPDGVAALDAIETRIGGRA